MLYRRGAGFVASGVIALSLGLVAQHGAFADYGPSNKDLVGVGSDTLQYLGDFVADGDHLADLGYNSLGNKNRVVNFDATGDANARFAYGTGALGSTTTALCAPGTGGTKGTGNATANHTDAPCGLNPTIVLRAGLSPVQRPNGSGAGADALQRDVTAGTHRIDYTRASACQGQTSGCSAKLSTAFDSIQVGTDPLAMLHTTTPATHAVSLSAAQLKSIYECTVTFWDDPSIGGTSHTTIIPIVPQVGSGTRSSFLGASGINVATPGSCVVTAEENDPTALFTVSSPADAIEPMSGGRLNMFLGLLSDGSANGVGGYFKDPSCGYALTTPAACVGPALTISPAVAIDTTGTPSSGPLFNIPRPLYVYFRHADINSATVAQPGSKLNWVRTMFYNPCDGFIAGSCSGPGLIYGPGGAPFYASSGGQALISAAGIVPAYAYTASGP